MPRTKNPQEMMTIPYFQRAAGIEEIYPLLESGSPLNWSDRVIELLRVFRNAERRIIKLQIKDEIRSGKRGRKVKGRPHAMTAERRGVAAAMVRGGMRGKNVLNVLKLLDGPSISQSAYYCWQKAFLAEQNGK